MADRLRAILRGAFARAGHLALWLGLYFAGAYVTAAVVLGRAVVPAALVAAFCAGIGLYLLDRVKVRDAWLDPADKEAQPERHGYLVARRRRLRRAAWASLGVGAVAAGIVSPVNLLLPPVGIVGVIAYSSLGRGGTRPKDVLLLKNLMPGAAIGGLAVVLAWQSPPGPPPTAPAAIVLLALALAISADAMLCDIDDVAADLGAGTGTIPSRFGLRATWILALAAHALAGAALIWAGRACGSGRAATTWVAADLVVTASLWAGGPTGIRDLIDARLALVAAVAWLAR